MPYIEKGRMGQETGKKIEEADSLNELRDMLVAQGFSEEAEDVGVLQEWISDDRFTRANMGLWKSLARRIKDPRIEAVVALT